MKNFIKGLLFTLLLVSSIGATNATTKSEVVIVTNRDCVNYLTSHGYSNVVVIQVMQDGTRLCDTSNPYNTYVFVSGNSIVGSEDSPND